MKALSLNPVSIDLPPVIFGTSGLGNLFVALEDQIKLEIIKEYFRLARGPVVFDSAGKYGAGLALEVLGSCLKQLGVQPENVIISNKLGWIRTELKTEEPTFEPGVWKNLKYDAIQKISYDGIMDCFEQGNELLGGYAPQMVSVHDPDEYVAAAKNEKHAQFLYENILEAYQALHDLKADGKVKAIGVGAKNWKIIQKIVKDVPLDWVMIANSMTIKNHPPDLAHFMVELESKGIKVINSAVFHSGFLIGTNYFDYRAVSRGTPEQNALFDWRDEFFAVCRTYNIKPSTACVQFALNVPGVTSIALNTTSVHRVKENLEMANDFIPAEFWNTMKAKGLIKMDFLKAIILIPFLFVFFSASFANAGKKQIIEAEAGKFAGGASKVKDNSASRGYSVSMARAGQSIAFLNLPASNRLAIRYASINVGTLSVTVNTQSAAKVNIHSSGALMGSFLYAVVDMRIPNHSNVTISIDTNDVAANIDYIAFGNGDLGLTTDIWNLPPLPVASGPFSADWETLSRKYTVPQWWRDAKFGAWAHWDPQSMPERGDWYARNMYIERNAAYAYHIKTFGHPSEYGYKDIAHNWVIDKWNPEDLMNLYVEMGARYFMAMGVHHDNFDCWDSKYQPWNSVHIGPKVDIVGTWEKIARKHNLRFGIGFHHTPPRTWGQFMPVRYTSDKSGPKQGISYDALQTIKDGKGKWWEGMDPVDLYGPVHTRNDDPLRSPFANQFMWRVDDAISKYHPDVIYFDEHAGDSQVDLGVHMGLGFLAPPLIANYYNKSLTWNNKKMEAVVNLKGVGGRWNSFQNSPQVLPLADRSLVKSSEMHIEPEIMAYSFQTETSIAEWHYLTGMKYMSSKKIIELLMENVCRNGTMLLNLTQHGRGDLDSEVVRSAKDIGAWLKVNGEAVYGSRPFEVYGEDSVRYTRNGGYVYATVLDWKDSVLFLKALRINGSTVGKISKVELLGSDVALGFVQDEKGLKVTPGKVASSLSGIVNSSLASGSRVLRITHDKGWFNDDDNGVVAPGWYRQCNLGTGDYNNDLTLSETPGDSWTGSFIGKGVAVIAPKEPKAGKIEIKIDGKSRATVDLSNSGGRQAQQMVYKAESLNAGKHSISIINRGSGKVSIDALIVQ